jgi:superfamily II DNA/RNA helicase
MDIFKTLTRGLKLDKQPLISPAISAKNDAVPAPKAAAMSECLDFFAEKKDNVANAKVPEPSSTSASVPVPVASHSVTLPEGDNVSFRSDADLAAFRHAHSIKLSLYDTSSTSAATSGESAKMTTQLTSLQHPDQILPVPFFAGFTRKWKLDPRIIEQLRLVKEREVRENGVKAERAVAALLPGADNLVPLVETPTPVQMQGTPVILSGRDALIVSPTGSGKTLAFILGVLGRLAKANAKATTGNVRVLILSPTRELAEQITEQFIRFMPLEKTTHGDRKPLFKTTYLSKAILSTWQSQSENKKRASILVATPLRLVEAIRAGLVDLSATEMLILDEADRLLSDTFTAQIDELLHRGFPRLGAVQKILVSATLPSHAEAAALSILSAPYKVFCGRFAMARTEDSEALDTETGLSVPLIRQELIYCGQGGEEEGVGKLIALRQLISTGRFTPPMLIFVGSQERADRLVASLLQLPQQLRVAALHSGLSQSKRASLLEAFRSGQIWFLVTTDLLARGLDCPAITCVLNYDFPDSTATYIHRIGRAGRAGRAGQALTLYTAQDVGDLRIVVNAMKESGCELPQWMLAHYTKPKGPGKLRRRLRKAKKSKSTTQ